MQRVCYSHAAPPSLFATHLASETRGQVHMWRLPASDSQYQRCVKAARENVKRHFFSVGRSTSASEQQLPTPPSLEVLSVFKVENRPLLHQFRCFTQAMPPSEVKIKGLFCTVPSESIEHCVVYGMHHDEQAFQRCLLPGDDIQVFNRARCELGYQACCFLVVILVLTPSVLIHTWLTHVQCSIGRRQWRLWISVNLLCSSESGQVHSARVPSAV